MDTITIPTQFARLGSNIDVYGKKWYIYAIFTIGGGKTVVYAKPDYLYWATEPKDYYLESTYEKPCETSEIYPLDENESGEEGESS